MGTNHRVASGRAALATYVVGKGDPVVFLHANICDSRMWTAQRDAIGATHKAIAYDRRGFGQTIAEPEAFSALADLMSVLDATANGEPAILVGCSLGGRIALDAALQHPSRVRALVLIAPNVPGAPGPNYAPEVQALMAQLKEAEAACALDRVNELKARLFLDGALAPEGRVRGPVRDLLLDMSGIALRAPRIGSDVDGRPIYHRLPEVTVPCFVMWGDLDFPNVQDRSRHVAATLPNGSGREIKDAAHLPSMDHPEEVTGLIAEFIRHDLPRAPTVTP